MPRKPNAPATPAGRFAGAALIYPFHEGSGTTVSDLSGNGFHGTLQANPPWVDSPPDGPMLTVGANHFVEIPDAPALRTPHSMTVVASFRVESLLGAGINRWLVSKFESTGNQRQFLLAIIDDVLRFRFYPTGSSTLVDIAGPTVVPGRVINVVAWLRRYSSTSAELGLITNLTSSATTTPANGVIFGSTAPVRIGVGPAGASPLIGEVGFAGIWPFAFAPEVAGDLARDPWQCVRPRRAASVGFRASATGPIASPDGTALGATTPEQGQWHQVLDASHTEALATRDGRIVRGSGSAMYRLSGVAASTYRAVKWTHSILGDPATMTGSSSNIGCWVGEPDNCFLVDWSTQNRAVRLLQRVGGAAPTIVRQAVDLTMAEGDHEFTLEADGGFVRVFVGNDCKIAEEIALTQARSLAGECGVRGAGTTNESASPLQGVRNVRLVSTAPTIELYRQPSQGGSPPAILSAYGSVRLPAATATETRLAVFAEGRITVSDNSPRDAIVWSFPAGEWAAIPPPIRIPMPSPILASSNWIVGNCSPIHTGGERIVLLLRVTPPGQNQDNMVPGNGADHTASGSLWRTISEDGGQTWGTPANVSVPAKPPEWGIVVPGPSPGARLQSGRLAHVIFGRSSGHVPWQGYVIYSDDDGLTWQRGAFLAATDEVNETAIVALPGERLVILARVAGAEGRVITFLSTDGGVTTTEPVGRRSNRLFGGLVQRAIRYPVGSVAGVNRVAFAGATRLRNTDANLDSWRQFGAIFTAPEAPPGPHGDDWDMPSAIDEPIGGFGGRLSPGIVAYTTLASNPTHVFAVWEGGESGSIYSNVRLSAMPLGYLGLDPPVTGGGQPPPLAPGTLSGPGSVTQTSATLSWTDATGGTGTITAQLQRRLAGSGSFADISGATASPHTDTGLSPSTAYEWRVRYSTPNDDPVYSGTVSATTPAPSDPGGGGGTPVVIPGQFGAPFVASRFVILTWSPGSSSPPGSTIVAQVEMRPEGGDWQDVPGATAPPATVEGLNPGDSYDFRVRYEIG